MFSHITLLKNKTLQLLNAVRKKIRFLCMFTENICIFTENIYVKMNPEFLNSHEHKCCCCDVAYSYWVNLQSEVALKGRNPLLGTSAVSKISKIKIPWLQQIKLWTNVSDEILRIPTITLKLNRSHIQLLKL